ncbi:DUF167 domain-containing protein [Candidatus Saccharibacteria bacterium]|nr:DUF167 domain-containing protein [Candidatus Saccharibacteria bacterium]
MLVKVVVKPNSKKGPLVEVASSDNADGAYAKGGNESGDRDLVVYVREKAHGGAANAAVVKLLADYYGVAKSQVELVRGARSREKSFEIIGR